MLQHWWDITGKTSPRPRAHSWLGWLAAAVALLPAAGTARAQERVPPPYPRVNLAPIYEVDSTWPKRPAEFKPGHVPGIAVDKNDNIYVYTRGNPPVQVYDSTGKFLRSWGENIIAPTGAHHIRIDHEGNIWLADIRKHVVLKCSPEGKVLLTLGTPGEHGEGDRQLNLPTDMAITRQGDIFISDGYGNNRIVHYDKTGKFVKTWGKLGIKPGEFSLPHSIALDSQGRLYVADRNNIRVQIFDQSGKLLDMWTNVICPWGIVITPQDEVWVCGNSPQAWHDNPKTPLSIPPKDQLIMKFNTAGRALQLWTLPKGTDGKEQPGDVNWMHAIDFDSKGNFYVGDIIGQRAQKFVLQK